MNGLFFAAVSLGLLMSLEKEKREEISLKNFFHIIKEGVEIFAASALAAVLCRWILSVLPLEKIRNGEFLILLLLPLGYELQRTQKKSWAFYITAAGFSFLAAERSRSFCDCVYLCVEINDDEPQLINTCSFAHCNCCHRLQKFLASSLDSIHWFADSIIIIRIFNLRLFP